MVVGNGMGNGFGAVNKGGIIGGKVGRGSETIPASSSTRVEEMPIPVWVRLRAIPLLDWLILCLKVKCGVR